MKTKHKKIIPREENISEIFQTNLWKSTYAWELIRYNRWLKPLTSINGITQELFPKTMSTTEEQQCSAEEPLKDQKCRPCLETKKTRITHKKCEIYKQFICLQDSRNVCNHWILSSNNFVIFTKLKFRYNLYFFCVTNFNVICIKRVNIFSSSRNFFNLK